MPNPCQPGGRGDAPGDAVGCTSMEARNRDLDLPLLASPRIRVRVAVEELDLAPPRASATGSPGTQESHAGQGGPPSSTELRERAAQQLVAVQAPLPAVRSDAPLLTVPSPCGRSCAPAEIAVLVVYEPRRGRTRASHSDIRPRRLPPRSARVGARPARSGTSALSSPRATTPPDAAGRPASPPPRSWHAVGQVTVSRRAARRRRSPRTPPGGRRRRGASPHIDAHGVRRARSGPSRRTDRPIGITAAVGRDRSSGEGKKNGGRSAAPRPPPSPPPRTTARPSQPLLSHPAASSAARPPRTAPRPGIEDCASPTHRRTRSARKRCTHPIVPLRSSDSTSV